MIKIDLENRYKGFKVTQKGFNKLALKATKIISKLPKFKAKKPEGIIQFVLTTDPEVRLLNKEYRGFDKATDVLSFSYFEDEKFPGDDTVGEIVISIDTAKIQAKEHHKTLVEEVEFLFLHGFLHIFGYDHEEIAERKEMFDLQDKIIGDSSWRKLIDP